uniref:Putative insulin growth factor binding protein n=1 Tax=Ixodes scapularis TaxID=6945 RepID=A0A4D5RQ07_IXOSC
MRVALLLLLVAAVSIIGVQSTSPPICTNVKCADQHCNPVSCTCGSYKGSCGCCDVCYKCANTPCIILHQDICEDGYECKLNDPDANIFQGAEGTCVASPSTAAPHGHAHH